MYIYIIAVMLQNTINNKSLTDKQAYVITIKCIIACKHNDWKKKKAQVNLHYIFCNMYLKIFKFYQ